MSRKFTMIAKEIDSKVYLAGDGNCGWNNCPSVLTAENGKTIVVGRRLLPQEIEELNQSGVVRVYDDEFAVEVSPELLKISSTKL